MSYRYTDEQNQVFIDYVEEYRNLILRKSPKKTEQLTKEFAIYLINTTPLSDRNIEGTGVAERLVYFDNLLAGVHFPFDYYLKGSYEKYFGKLPRNNGNKDLNNWKTQHEARREKEYNRKS